MQREQFNFSLSLNNAKKIPFEKYESNFTFIVNNKRYETNRLVADVLSPIINKYHYQDSSFNEFTISIKHKENNKQDYFNEFLNLINFDEVELDETRRKLFSQYFLQLGNTDEYVRLQLPHQTELSPNNIVDRLLDINETVEQISTEITSDDFTFHFLDEIDQLVVFASSHFTEIDKEKLKELDISTIEEIIKNPSLRLSNEDELLDFILTSYEEDNRYSVLFEYVDFTSVSEKVLEKFVDLFSLEDMNQGTWKSICNRFFASKTTNKRKLNEKIIEKKYSKSQEFNGIMNFLNTETKENGTFEITTNSLYNNSNSYHPNNLIAYNRKDIVYFSSSNIENATICFDFKDKKIQLESYSIESCRCPMSKFYLKNWVIEVSNDGKNWEIIDDRNNDSQLNKPDAVANFEINQNDGFYRFIQLRQTGKNWGNSLCIMIRSLEFFGKIKMLNEDK